MNEEKEELKKQVEKLQAQVTLSHAGEKSRTQEVGSWLCPGGGHMGWRALVAQLAGRTLRDSPSTLLIHFCGPQSVLSLLSFS